MIRKEKIQPAYLKPREAAAYLSVSVATLYALKGEGVIKFYKLGGSTLLKISELDAAVEIGSGSRRCFEDAKMDKPPELFKDSRGAEVYPTPLPQLPDALENEMAATFEARIKRYEMFCIINVDPFEGKFP
jgi:excisionase family DNA binding protein